MPEKVKIYHAPAEVLFQTVGNEAVLLNLNNNHYYGLNEVGARMWELLQEHGALDLVVAEICYEFEVDESTARQDLETHVANLIAREMLTESVSDL